MAASLLFAASDIHLLWLRMPLDFKDREANGLDYYGGTFPCLNWIKRLDLKVEWRRWNADEEIGNKCCKTGQSEQLHGFTAEGDGPTTPEVMLRGILMLKALPLLVLEKAVWHVILAFISRIGAQFFQNHLLSFSGILRYKSDYHREREAELIFETRLPLILPWLKRLPPLARNIDKTILL